MSTSNCPNGRVLLDSGGGHLKLKELIKKYGLAWFVALLSGVFRAFVLMNLWNWFVTAVFHIPAISFLQVWGISLVIGLFSFDSNRFVTEQKRWNVLMTTLEHCVPEDKKEDLRQELKDNLGDEMTDVWASVGGRRPFTSMPAMS